MAEKIIERSLTDELKQSYGTYAMSVIVARALPDVRDGFKPVHRRILYVMSTLGLLYNRPFKKCATVVGQVISAYHPHGDAAIYDSLVRMAQDFSLRYPLIDGQGNFGSMDGDKAAAYRYTEARMARISDEMLKDLQKNTVDFRPNFDESTNEPTVLPSAIPNLLLNGSSGIAVGMATNIPPHNLREVCDALIHYIAHRDTSLEAIMQFIKAPDFPTGGIIHGAASIKDAYASGRGSFRLRGKLDIETAKNGRESIVITEVPYQVNKAEMIKKMAELVRTDVLRGPSELRDESDRKGVRVVIELKRDVNVQTVINLLYKHTALEISYNINAVALVNYTPRTLALLDLLKYFYEHRFTVTTRRIKFDLKQAEARLHIVAGFLHIALPNIDALIKTIRSSHSVEEAKTNLSTQFSFSAKQAQAVLDMRLARLVKLEQEQLQEEFDALEQAIKEYKALLAEPKKIDELLTHELVTIKKTYGDDRRTAIEMAEISDLALEDLIHKDDVIVSLTHSTYIKQLPLATYRKQGRGGMGIKGTSAAREDDALAVMLVANTHDLLFFITNTGKVYYFKALELPTSTRIAKGVHLKTFIALAADERVQEVLRFPSDNAFWDEPIDLVMATKRGKTKRTPIKDFINAKRNGVRAITLAKGDEVASAVAIKRAADAEVMFFTQKGLALRTSLVKIRQMGRAAAGVIAMRLKADDSIIALIVVENDRELLVVSTAGTGKRFAFAGFMKKGRGGLGQRYMRLDNKTGLVCGVRSVAPKSDFLLTTRSGNMLRLTTTQIPLLSRTARGVRLVTLKNDQDNVLYVTPAASTLDEDEKSPSAPPSNQNLLE